jgi:pimeloyl-ACP methyl ester carboxylesterase
MQRLAGFTRLILFDKRGMGPLRPHRHRARSKSGWTTFPRVMDAVGSERAVLHGVKRGRPSHRWSSRRPIPERTAALIFIGGEVKEIIEDDWPIGQSTREQYDERLEKILSGETPWGAGAPRLVRAEQGVRPRRHGVVVARLERTAASPAAAVAFMRLGSALDVRHVAPSIHVPTLVMHSPEDSIVPFAQGRWLAEQNPGRTVRRAQRPRSRPVVRRRGSGHRGDARVS